VSAGKAQLLGDSVATETSTTPAAAKLEFFERAYEQLINGGANQ
jgi:hypothetical protein